MPNGRDTMAQAVYLAQLEAARGNCKCNTCRILRKASKMMTEEFLNPPEANPGLQREAAKLASIGQSESFTIDQEED